MTDVKVAGRDGGLYRALDWPVRLAAVNLLWLAGTLAGLIVAGVAPATVALAWLLREYSLGRSPRLWRDFWRQWRAQLVPAQLRLGVPMATVFVLGFYLTAAANEPAAVFRGVTVGLAIASAGYLATLLYLPAVLVNVDLPTVSVWKVAGAIAWRQPMVTVGVAVASALLTVVTIVLAPAALLFYVPSLPVLLATQATLRAFARLQTSAERD